MIDVNLSRKSNGGGEHDQIIHFVGGVKRLIQGVQYVWENEMVHVIDYLGIEYIINKQNVLFIERFSKGGKGYEGVTGSGSGASSDDAAGTKSSPASGGG